MPEADRKNFESAADALRSDVTMAAANVTWDAHVRQLYQRSIATVIDQLRNEAIGGRMSWGQAAEEGNRLRNDTMEILRLRSSPSGRAMAEAMKRTGLTLNEVVAKYTRRLSGADADFTRLSAAQQDAIFAEVVAAAGRSNSKVNSILLGASRVGRGLLFLSLAISVYAIATSNDPVYTAEKEAVTIGAGLFGGMAGGAVAGLACGPGAPICVSIGAFAGGAAAAFGVSWFW